MKGINLLPALSTKSDVLLDAVGVTLPFGRKIAPSRTDIAVWNGKFRRELSQLRGNKRGILALLLRSRSWQVSAQFRRSSTPSPTIAVAPTLLQRARAIFSIQRQRRKENFIPSGNFSI
jgi:hypothetical protein